MAAKNDKSLMRNLGEFFGHIVKGVKTDPAKPETMREVRREVEEVDQGDMILRRTTIEEIEFKAPDGASDDQASNDAQTEH